ncbi:hypothetical protein EW146_g1420 [Bondarzewia mesenterica]|uniref:DNA polymerase eta n=1 Tax=Bondarzewia mesenterica TaxID=1095465 RepID=A0A4S4M3Z0_9AGAM|nr:hypothetical protein EW146_g1420 [Bondarzewia mesenterica]
MAFKTVAVLDESELKDGQMKEVEFESGKVLLSRLGDKIHATSAFCTHYGAPLVKGALTADGRIVCPWHGACFNVCTGDIEDAPAPDALHLFKASITNGKIQVTADPSRTTSEYKSRAPRLLTAGPEVGGPGIVIVGGGSATFHTIGSLREHGYRGPITVFSKETYAPIDRTKLSKALITDASKIEWRTPADLKIKYGTTLRTATTVTSIDSDAMKVTLDEKEQMPYDILILASGGIPRRLPVEGAELENVYTLRGVQDAQKIDAECQEGKKLVVIGSSFISMELVVAVSKRKLESIHVIGMEEYPFEAVLGKEVGKGLKQFHESQGVIFHTSTSVQSIRSSSSAPNRAAEVILASGEVIPADVVVMGVGVRPATDYLRASGWELEKDGGVKVDKFLKVIGKNNIFAVGDIATYPQIDGGMRRIEHWNVAGNHGRAIGKTIAGDPQPFVKVPIFWSAQGQQLRYCGVGAGYDDIIIKGDPAEMKFIAYYIKSGKVVAVASMQNDPVVSKASELLRLDLMPLPEELKAGKPPSSLWKGKSKSTASTAYEDLNLPITYRHFLSPSLGARDPLRVIALCDSDAFYAACEQQRLDIDPARPLVVRQWDALIAVNYPARKYGITRMSKWKEAVKKCPDLVVVHVATYKEGDKEPGYWDKVDTATHKVSIVSLVSVHAADADDFIIEKASIDEAFIDFTRPVREKLLERYPYLAAVPPDAPNGLDSVLPHPPPIAWDGKGIVIPINPVDESSGGAQAGQSEDEIADGEDVQTTWHDVALSVAAEMMDKIRADVRKQLGYTTSAGIARNKFLAKASALTASYKKFDSQSILRNAAIPNYLKPMPFQKIRFLGGKLGKALAEEYDVSTVGDLLSISLEEMQHKFGEESIWVYELLRDHPVSFIVAIVVKEKPAMAKSMMASKNLPHPITTVAEGPHWLRVLAAELALRLNDARTSAPVWPKSIVLHIRHGNVMFSILHSLFLLKGNYLGYQPSRSRQAAFPFVRDLSVDVIAAAGEKLWKDLTGGGSKETPIKVTNIALGFTGLEGGESGQQSIEGYFQTGGSMSKPISGGEAGSTAGSKRKRGNSTDAHDLGPANLNPKYVPVAESTRAGDIDQQSIVSDSFVCSRCHKRIQVGADDTRDESDGNIGLEAALTRLRMEHDDFHLAQDLSKAVETPALRSGMGKNELRVLDQAPGRQPKKKKADKSNRSGNGREGEGIAKFFTRKS